MWFGSGPMIIPSSPTPAVVQTKEAGGTSLTPATAPAPPANAIGQLLPWQKVNYDVALGQGVTQHTDQIRRWTGGGQMKIDKDTLYDNYGMTGDLWGELLRDYGSVPGEPWVPASLSGR